MMNLRPLWSPEPCNGVPPDGVAIPRLIYVVVSPRSVLRPLSRISPFSSDRRLNKAAEIDPEKVTVGEIYELLTAGEEDAIANSIRGLRSLGVQRGVVVNGRAVMGVIVLDGRVCFLAGQLKGIVGLINLQPEREKHKFVAAAK